MPALLVFLKCIYLRDKERETDREGGTERERARSHMWIHLPDAKQGLREPRLGHAHPTEVSHTGNLM